MTYIMNSSDWTTKYGDCYVRVLYDGKVRAAKVVEFIQSPDNEVLVSLRISVASRRYVQETYSVNSENINWEFPDLGVINIRGQAVWIYRKTKLDSNVKYRQGLHDNNVYVVPLSNLVQFVLDGGWGVVSSLSLESVNDIFNAEYIPFDLAEKLIRTGKHASIAISPQYALRVGIKTNKVELVKNKFTVGFVVDGQVSLFEELFFLKEELETFGFHISLLEGYISKLKVPPAKANAKPYLKNNTNTVKFGAMPSSLHSSDVWITGGTNVSIASDETPL